MGKTTLKWTKCPKTAQIVEKGQNGVILGLKCRHRAKWGLGMKKKLFQSIPFIMLINLHLGLYE